MVRNPDSRGATLMQGVRWCERLKWACGLALVAILGGMGVLYQNQQALARNLREVREDVGRIDERTIQLDKRLGSIEEMVRRLVARTASNSSIDGRTAGPGRHARLRPRERMLERQRGRTMTRVSVPRSADPS